MSTSQWTFKNQSVHYTINVITTIQLFSAIAFAFFACDVSTRVKCQRKLSLTNSWTCFWRSRGRTKRSTISMRSFLSSCKRMQSHKTEEEEEIHLDCCLSSIHESLCRHIFALWMCALRLMGLCQRWWWHRRLWTDPSPMLWGLELWGSHQYLSSAQLSWCLSWSASFLIGGQGCYAAYFSLRPYLEQPGRYGPTSQRHHNRNHNTCLSLDDTWRSWDCLGGRLLWLWCIVCIRQKILSWRHPGMTVHYPITNSRSLDTEVRFHWPSHTNSLQSRVSVVSWLRVISTFQTFCIRIELRCYLSNHRAETRTHCTWTVIPLPTFYWF